MSDEGSDDLVPAQIRAARALLDWSMTDLALAAGVSVTTIKRVEVGPVTIVSGQMVGIICTALERAGVGFIRDDGRGHEVRINRP